MLCTLISGACGGDGVSVPEKNEISWDAKQQLAMKSKKPQKSVTTEHTKYLDI